MEVKIGQKEVKIEKCTQECTFFINNLMIPLSIIGLDVLNLEVIRDQWKSVQAKKWLILENVPRDII